MKPASVRRRTLVRSLFLAAGLALCAWQALAELCAAPLPQPTPQLLAQARAQARNHGFLWRISKGGHASYLYGTMHVGKLEWMFPGPAEIRALQASSSIALEINVHDPVLMQQLQAGIAAGEAAGASVLVVAHQSRSDTAPSLKFWDVDVPRWG